MEENQRDTDPCLLGAETWRSGSHGGDTLSLCEDRDVRGGKDSTMCQAQLRLVVTVTAAMLILIFIVIEVVQIKE